jgi:predicted dehydrogenase
VLLEKPVTIDPRQAWELTAAAERLGRHVVVAFSWNYQSMVRRAKWLMEARSIGEIEQVSIAMSSQTRELLSNTGAYPDAAPESVPEAATWTDPRLSGGGYGQAQLSHALGLALWLTGLRGREAFAFTSAPLGAPVELHDAAALRFDNGAIGTLSGGSAHLGADGNKHYLEVRAIGSEGQLLVDVQREAVWHFRRPDEEIKLALPPEAGRYDSTGPDDALVDLALGRATRNCSPLELGARTVEILDAMYRSARSGRAEEVHA